MLWRLVRTTAVRQEFPGAEGCLSRATIASTCWRPSRRPTAPASSAPTPLYRSTKATFSAVAISFVSAIYRDRGLRRAAGSQAGCRLYRAASGLIVATAIQAATMLLSHSPMVCRI